MGRHNRRRTRGGQKKKTSSISTTSTSTSTATLGSALYPYPNVTLKYTYPGTTTPPPTSSYSSSNSPHALSCATHSAFASWMPPNVKSLPIMLSVSRNTIPARQWHNRYMAWQVREQRQREEAVRLEAEKRRIFGIPWDDDGIGFSGDDYGDHRSAGFGEDGDTDADGLYDKMLEYFGGLDFIE